MNEHEGLVHYIVRQQWRGTLSYGQVLHEGGIGLWRAILGFDPGRGVAFSMYASVVIARQVWRAIAQAEKGRPDRSHHLWQRYLVTHCAMCWRGKWRLC